MATGLDGQGDGQVSFSHTGRTQENDIFLFGQEGQVKEFQDGLFVQLGVKEKSYSSMVFAVGRPAIFIAVWTLLFSLAATSGKGGVKGRHVAEENCDTWSIDI